MAAGLTCSESEELLALAALGVLTRAEGLPLDEHLAGCPQCRHTAAAYLQTVASLPATLETPEPPPALRRTLMRQLYAHGMPQHAETQMERVRQAFPRRRMLTIATSVVALAAIIVAIVALLRPAGDSTTAYTVVGTTSAPGVQGTLTYDSTTQQAVMTVTGLPALAPTDGAQQQVYEVWLVGGSGANGAAFLTQSPLNHSWSTVIHTDLSQYTAVAATAEPYGGSLQPTSPQLLSVQLTR